MTVVYTTSHNVDKYLPTALNSLFTHNPDAFVYIIAEEDHIGCIKRTENIKIISKKDIPDFHYQTSNTKENGMMMARCWLSKILKEDKVLYLDIDTIVLGSLNELWNIDITDYAIAAWVEDKDENLLPESFRWPRRRLQKSRYVNSGVILFNLKFIREHGIDDKQIKLLNEEKFPFPDQDVINLACDGYIKPLEPIYNFSNLITKKAPDIKDVKIYHMVNYKFWNGKNPKHKYHYLWDKYYVEEI